MDRRLLFSFSLLLLAIATLAVAASTPSSASIWDASAEDAVQPITWKVTYGTASPLGVSKRILLINGQFPGPQISTVTNVLLQINVFNAIDEPLLFTWNGVWQRRTCWQDGVLGTNCPIPPGQNFTYFFQAKDQIGSYFYFPTTAFHKAAGGYGGLKIDNRIIIPLPYKAPDGEFFLQIGDWYNADHKDLQRKLDGGAATLGLPDGIVINGQGRYGTTVTVDAGKTYRLRVCNVGVAISLNLRIGGHKLTVVETEGSHTQQNVYDNLDIHVGQCYSFLVTFDQPPADYSIVASSRFITPPLQDAIAIVHYSNSASKALPPPPLSSVDLDSSLRQALTIKRNLTANAARPNPQGSFHYGMINVTETIVIEGFGAFFNGKQRYSANGISFQYSGTPLKLADYFNVGGVFAANFPRNPSGSTNIVVGASVLTASFRSFLEVVFQNDESIVQSWHIDGYSAFVVGYGAAKWSPASRVGYNLLDGVARSTFQVYPKSWTAVMMELDNVGLWNVRSQVWERAYLGEQLYLKVPMPPNAFLNEVPIPSNVLLCGKALGHHP